MNVPQTTEVAPSMEFAPTPLDHLLVLAILPSLVMERHALLARKDTLIPMERLALI